MEGGVDGGGCGREESIRVGLVLECGEGYFLWCMEGKLMCRCINIWLGEIGMDVISCCIFGDFNKLFEGVF